MMIHFLKKKAALALIACLLVVFAGCGGSGSTSQLPVKSESDAPAAESQAPVADEPDDEPAEAPTDATLEGQTLRLAINATFAPFEAAVVNDNGETEFEGIDIDIANHLAETLGFELEITDMTFDGLVGAVTSGRADFVISGISPTEERLQSVDFSTSYFWPTIAIISRSEALYPTSESLNGKKVAVPFGTSYEKKAETFENVEIVSITGTPSVIQELLNGRVAAAVIDGCQAAEFVKVHPELEFTLLPIEKILEDSFAVMFPKNSEILPVIDAALVEMMDNDELDKIIVKWLGEDYLASYKEGLQ